MDRRPPDVAKVDNVNAPEMARQRIVRAGSVTLSGPCIDVSMTRLSYNRRLHLLAIATVVATFPLIFMGGLVTSHAAGMSVPDWPNSYGYNMFLFPPRLWVGGILYEHTHRLMGTVVGLLAIALTIVSWTKDKRRHIRWLCTALLGTLILQGVLGGLRVVL